MSESGERGNSPVTAVFGFAIFLAFFALATQLALHLYATSVVTSAAFDAARFASAEGRACVHDGARAVVDAYARSRLGQFGDLPDVHVGCNVETGVTQVTIAGPSPANLFGWLGADARDWSVTRTAHVATERAP